MNKSVRRHRTRLAGLYFTLRVHVVVFIVYVHTNGSYGCHQICRREPHPVGENNAGIDSVTFGSSWNSRSNSTTMSAPTTTTKPTTASNSPPRTRPRTRRRYHRRPRRRSSRAKSNARTTGGPTDGPGRGGNQSNQSAPSSRRDERTRRDKIEHIYTTSCITPLNMYK